VAGRWLLEGWGWCDFLEYSSRFRLKVSCCFWPPGRKVCQRQRPSPCQDFLQTVTVKKGNRSKIGADCIAKLFWST